MLCVKTPDVDRERFLFLVAALAATSCNLPLPAEQPEAQGRPSALEATGVVEPGFEDEQVGPPASDAPTVFIESTVAPERHELEEPPAPACDNGVGRVDCSQISSTCEGLQGSCELLVDYPYRPRVAEAIARCWSRVGHRACNMRVRQQCNLEGIRQACLDPTFEPECQEHLRSCRDAGLTPSYTVDECVQVLSAIADAGERGWASGAMGPTREGCKLMFPVY